MAQPRKSSSSSTSTMTVGDREEPISLASSIVHKFYEPIMLLVSLIQVAILKAIATQPEDPFDLENDKHVYCAFINKLSHVCDSEKGGTTVTSLMILLENDKAKTPHYWFASNQRSPDEIEAAVAFVRRLLRKINDATRTPKGDDTVRKQLLNEVLRFNRPRISSYLSVLQSQARECLERCFMDDTDDNNVIIKEMTGIVEFDSRGASISAPKAEYFQCFATTIRLLIKLQNTNAGELIKHRAQAGRMPGQRSIECWSDFLHTAKRILAYLQSVQFLLLAKERYPGLFKSPLVSFVPSSNPIPKPTRAKSLTADGIVGRMTRKEKQIQIFKDFVHTLQAFDLDQRIVREYQKDSFHPIVHAELLLLNWLQYHGGIKSTRFFKSCMYIGSSKPTCKFCHYYFLEHRSGVEHRPCHGNIYTSWRVPDVFPSQGEAALNARQVMVDRLLQRIRKETFDIVRKKIPPTYKEEDSNTFSASFTLEERWTIDGGSSADIDEVTSLVGEMDIEERRYDFDDIDGQF